MWMRRMSYVSRVQEQAKLGEKHRLDDVLKDVVPEKHSKLHADLKDGAISCLRIRIWMHTPRKAAK